MRVMGGKEVLVISKKSKAVYIILAILFGVFGVHQFYLKNYKKAIIYFLFSWTGIPYLCAICDAIRVNKIFNNLYRYKDENYTVLQKKNEDIESKEELGKIFKKQIKIEKSNCNDDVIDKKILINDFCNILTKVCNRENISKKEEREETVSFENKNEIRYHNENLSENNITLEKSNCNDDVIDKKILINDFCNILTKVCSRKNISKKEEKEETVSFKNKNEIKYHNENLSENNINLEKSNCNDDVINKKILISDFGNMVAKVCDRKTINKIEKKEEKISFDNKNKFKNIIENLSGNNRFYNESDIILEKYKHLITRDYIKCSIHEIIGNKKNGNKMISMELITDSTKFIKDSVKYSNTRGQKCSFKPLMCYWTTFDKLDAKQKKWYFYWRENVLKGNYIDTDLSYIILFVYELLNYSFNDNAAFNISMLERLYDAYLDRYKKLERYIKPWISDFLLELGEVSIGEKDYNVEDKIYINLNVSNDLIDKISITSWKPFIQYNETKFFEANKYKVYKVFKKNMLILNNFYCEKGTSVLKEWFDEKEKSTNLYLYNSAVIGREVKIKNISYIKHEPKAKMYHQITQIFRLSENIVRNQMNENRKIKVEINQIPEGYVEYLDIVLGDLKVDEKIKNRFKNVKNKEKDNSVEIPKRVYNEKIDKKPEISFDDELINNISSEGDSLIELFNQEYDDKLSNEVLFKLKEEKNYMNGLISKEELSEDNEIVKISKSIATEKVDEKSKIKFNDKLVNTIRSEGDALIELFNEEYGDKLKDDIHLNLKKENKQKEKKDINELFFKEDLSVDVDSFIKSLTNIEKRFICKFKNLEIYTKNAMEFSKENGKMASMLVDGINEKSMESLEDIFIELIDEKYTIYEDYRNVAKEIRRGN